MQDNKLFLHVLLLAMLFTTFGFKINYPSRISLKLFVDFDRSSISSVTIETKGFKVISNEGDDISTTDNNAIILSNVGSGWGNGAHPTTKLCMDFLIDHVKPKDNILDYGTGSGILSILAAKLGATKCVAVDIDDDSIAAALRNTEINHVDDIVDVVHTKQIYVGEDRFPICDITVANILPGPLSRLVAPIWSFTKPGGWLCISGLRRVEVPDIQRAYSPIVDMTTSTVSYESHPNYGEWACWTVRMKVMSEDDIKETRRYFTEKSLE